LLLKKSRCFLFKNPLNNQCDLDHSSSRYQGKEAVSYRMMKLQRDGEAMKVSAVIFDMDGVIFDTERIAAQSWRMAEKEFGIKVDEAFLKSLLGVTCTDARPVFEKYFGNAEVGVRISDWRHQWIQEKYEKDGIPIKKGVREIFRFLKEEGIPKALATSSNRQFTESYFKLAKLELSFDYIITGDLLAHGKPDPEIYLKAAEGLKKDIHSCMVIEDSLVGVQGGIASGAMTVMVPDLIPPTPEITEKAFSVQKSLLDVIELIRKANQN
jgi:HAD superfamily hydrolase (TIGR01509 family)